MPTRSRQSGVPVDFVLEHKLTSAWFFALLGYFPEPGNGFRTMMPWHRSIHRGWGYQNGNFVTHFPLRMPPSKLQLAIIDAYQTIYSPKQAYQALKRRKLTDALSKLLIRSVWPDVAKPMKEYVSFLEMLEDGLYDSEGTLHQDLLIQRVEKDPRWTFQAVNRTMKALVLPPVELSIPGEKIVTCPRG